jgi:endogenous inhibitor of DNA gyrase (YacG/DUF329 family)
MKYELKCPHCAAEVSPYACADAVAINEKYDSTFAFVNCTACTKKVKVTPITEYALTDPDQVYDWENDIPF